MKVKNTNEAIRTIVPMVEKGRFHMAVDAWFYAGQRLGFCLNVCPQGRNAEYRCCASCLEENLLEKSQANRLEEDGVGAYQRTANAIHAWRLRPPA